jgi:hypothetical protein
MQLFDFRDLLGFSLNFKLNFNHTHMHEMATGKLYVSLRNVRY